MKTWTACQERLEAATVEEAFGQLGTCNKLMLVLKMAAIRRVEWEEAKAHLEAVTPATVLDGPTMRAKAKMGQKG